MRESKSNNRSVIGADREGIDSDRLQRDFVKVADRPPENIASKMDMRCASNVGSGPDARAMFARHVRISGQKFFDFFTLKFSRTANIIGSKCAKMGRPEARAKSPRDKNASERSSRFSV
jgi:hypothetical protein